MKTLTYPALLSYSLFGLPLAMVALPIYVYVPQFYAAQFGLSLTLIGSALLIARILDAFIDPAIGILLDQQRSRFGCSHFLAASLPLLIVGFILLFHPQQLDRVSPFMWFLGSLLIVYLGFSLATISYQSWGAALTQAKSQRTRLTAMREGTGLIGVIIAAVLPSIAGMNSLSLTFLITLMASAWLLLRVAPRPEKTSPLNSTPIDWLLPFRNSQFCWLFAVFMINGIAAAIPATLFLFFANDYLALPHYSGLFLVLYFLAAALSMPLWVALAKRWGEQKAWLWGMGLAMAAFIWTYALSAGDLIGFALICTFSGIALGADLALPPALLAAVIANKGEIGQREGAYFGMWSWATKMNLALAAGISLPLLESLGYQVGSAQPTGLQALLMGYALLPCCLKFMAALLLWRAPLQHV
jgi:Na+/melibiose symporter-like transporter